ncbi:MAG: hypothetical protein ACYSSO_02520 [Planctomycetota bacterium]
MTRGKQDRFTIEIAVPLRKLTKTCDKKLQVFFYGGFGIKGRALKIEFDIIAGC